MNQIIMLGTGNATVTQCYNTCFLLETSTTRLLVDAGGGNGVLRQLQRAGVALRDLHHLFVTHAHTDHVLGVIWVIRMVAQCKDYEGHLHVYGHDKVLLVLRTIIDMILAKKQLARVAQRVVFHQLEDGDRFPVGDMTIQCFDIHSTKEKQYGFRAELPRSVSPASCLRRRPGVSPGGGLPGRRTLQSRQPSPRRAGRLADGRGLLPLCRPRDLQALREES